MLTSLVDGRSLVLPFRGIGHFKQEVAFIQIEEGEHLITLTHIAGELCFLSLAFFFPLLLCTSEERCCLFCWINLRELFIQTNTNGTNICASKPQLVVVLLPVWYETAQLELCAGTLKRTSWWPSWNFILHLLHTFWPDSVLSSGNLSYLLMSTSISQSPALARTPVLAGSLSVLGNGGNIPTGKSPVFLMFFFFLFLVFYNQTASWTSFPAVSWLLLWYVPQTPSFTIWISLPSDAAQFKFILDPCWPTTCSLSGC